MRGRGYRRLGRLRGGVPQAVVQSFKKVLNYGEASFTAGFTSDRMIIGKDSQTGEQVNATDSAVPTGSVVKYVEIQIAMNNPVDTPIYINCSIQYTLDGQNVIDPDQVGGSLQRNQVLHQDLYSVGANQNSTHKFKFKIPKRYQRIRAGTEWKLVWSTNGTVNRTVQMIYKFYR